MLNFYGGTTTTQGLVAHLHVILASGTTPTLDVDLEDSPDDIVYSTVTGMTFAQATAPSCERLETANGSDTIDQYIRSIWTIAGTTPSFTFVVAVAVKS